jgi:hypothetical protein
MESRFDCPLHALRHACSDPCRARIEKSPKPKPESLVLSLCDAHARRSKHFISPSVTALELVGDCAGFHLIAVDRADGIVETGIEGLT